jgi:hypothetical protein
MQCEISKIQVVQLVDFIMVQSDRRSVENMLSTLKFDLSYCQAAGGYVALQQHHLWLPVSHVICKAGS